MKGEIINCFYGGSTSGFGDFLRGSIHLYNRCKSMGVGFNIDVSHHDINEFIKTNYNKKFNKSDIYCIISKVKEEGWTNQNKEINYKINKIFLNIKEKETKYIFTHFDFLCNIKNDKMIDFINKSPSLSKDCCKFFRENIKFSDLLKRSVKTELKKHNLKTRKFNIVHFRIGDDISFYKKDDTNNKYYEECLEICEKKTKKYKYPLVVLSDNNDLKSYLEKKSKEKKINLIVFHKESCHTQENPSDSENKINVTKSGLFYAAFDMMLISLASRSSSYSVYGHGSGFITWICKIYNVPFKLYRLKEK